MVNLINKYNNKDSLIMISLYPKKGEVYSAGKSGIASYAKNIVLEMQRNIIVIADYEDKPKIYQEQNALVVRCFKKNNPLMWFQIYKCLKNFPQVKKILIQFDFALYGNVITSSFILPFLIILRIYGYHLSLVLHTVLLDIKKLSGHVGILGNSYKDKIKTILYNLIFRLFYIFLSAANRIIVLEEPLKNKLSKIIPSSEIITIAHGVDASITVSEKSKARSLLNIENNKYVVLFFGFVNWVKGADFFVDTFQDKTSILGKQLLPILAGGESATLKDQSYYQTYFKNILKTIKKSKTMKLTGYVPQKQLDMYFSAADLVVLPYRYFMNASGVLSLIFSYKKPFIISSELSEMLDSPEFKNALKRSELSKDDLVFELTPDSLFDKSEAVLKNGLKQKMINFTMIMANQRAYKNIASQYEQILFAPQKAIQKAYLLDYEKQYRK